MSADRETWSVAPELSPVLGVTRWVVRRGLVPIGTASNEIRAKAIMRECMKERGE